MPRDFSTTKKDNLHKLTLAIMEKVEKQLPVGFSYDKNSRLILPHSVFLQQKTPNTVTEIRKPQNIKTRMRFYKNWARKAIGMDAFQDRSIDTRSRNTWKTFHLDKIDDLRLFDQDEIQRIFKIDEQVSDDINLKDGFNTVPDFVKNWNHWFRIFLAQTKANFDLK
jgi:hypothetical protein